jgi:hypothetical protein
MRVLVCGGRQFDDVSFARAILDRLHAEHRFQVLIEGDARGADRIAGDWADLRGVEHVKFPADWEKLGRKAGPIRNEQMLREGKPDLVIALPGGRGTANMVRIAREAGVRVIEITSGR